MEMIPYAHHFLDAQDIKSVIEALESDSITQGAEVGKFERHLCQYTGAKFCTAVSSGTAALDILTRLLNLQSGKDVVFIPAITFCATANVVIQNGGVVHFVDIDPMTYNINLDSLLEGIEFTVKAGRRPRAIYCVHLAGLPCDMIRLRAIADQFNMALIEDAAHALGASYASRVDMVGGCRYSDATIFSFHPAKHITTGEGGALLTNDEKWDAKSKLLRSHGITKEWNQFKNKPSDCAEELPLGYSEMQDLGHNFRMCDFQACLGSSQLVKIENFVQKRKYLAELYCDRLAKILAVKLPQLSSSGGVSSLHLFIVQLRDDLSDRRDAFAKYLGTKGIGVQLHYVPVYKHLYYQGLPERWTHCECPIAEKYWKSVLSLPLHYKMGEKEVSYICDQVIKFFNADSVRAKKTKLDRVHGSLNP